MELLKTVLGAALGIFGALASNMIASDLYDRCPRLARRLLERAVDRLPPDQRDLRREEWAAHLLDCPSKLSQVMHAVGAWLAAGRIASQQPRPKMKLNLDYLITGSAFVVAGMTAESMMNASGGAPWWVLAPSAIVISGSISEIYMALKIRRKNGNIIEL